jgi:hypothetical protein
MNTTNATTNQKIPWRKRPENIEKRKKYLKEYNQRPRAKELRKGYNKSYNGEYNKRPDRIERRKKYLKKYYQRPEVKERFRNYVKDYIKRPETKELRKIQRKKLTDKGYYKRLEIKQNRLKRYETDINYKILLNLRSRMSNVVKSFGSGKKAHKTIELLGCTILELKMYLESLWREGMSWENYAKDGWHIDHIKPCNTFDLTDQGQQKQCFHYTNLRPLWAKDNLSRPKDGSDII